MKKDFRKALAEEVLLADGAIGTLLTSRGASADQARSPLNLSDPDAVREVHDDYVAAGARIVTTNTWDANRVKLTAHEWADSLEKINREGVRLAREAASGELVFVAGSIGPLGALVKPYGSLHLTQVREIFEEQARVLLEGGVDLVVLETFGSLLEAAEAVRSVRGLSATVPIVAEMPTTCGSTRRASSPPAPRSSAGAAAPRPSTFARWPARSTARAACRPGARCPSRSRPRSSTSRSRRSSRRAGRAGSARATS